MRKDEAFLLDMLLAAQRLREFVAGVSRERFEEDTLIESAVRYQEQVLGEAAANETPEYRLSHPGIPWDKLRGVRHRLVHGYRDVEVIRVWRLIEHDVPGIIATLEKLVPPEGDQPA